MKLLIFIFISIIIINIVKSSSVLDQFYHFTDYQETRGDVNNNNNGDVEDNEIILRPILNNNDESNPPIQNQGRLFTLTGINLGSLSKTRVIISGFNKPEQPISINDDQTELIFRLPKLLCKQLSTTFIYLLIAGQVKSNTIILKYKMDAEVLLIESSPLLSLTYDNDDDDDDDDDDNSNNKIITSSIYIGLVYLNCQINNNDPIYPIANLNNREIIQCSKPSVKTINNVVGLITICNVTYIDNDINNYSLFEYNNEIYLSYDNDIAYSKFNKNLL